MTNFDPPALFRKKTSFFIKKEAIRKDFGHPEERIV